MLPDGLLCFAGPDGPYCGISAWSRDASESTLAMQRFAAKEGLHRAAIKLPNCKCAVVALSEPEGWVNEPNIAVPK